MDASMIPEILRSALRLATPMIFAAMGGIYSERSGVISIGLEGLMLMGAFVGFITTFFTGNNLVLGFAAAALSGVLLNALYGYLVIELGINQAITGTAVVMFASGFTSFGLRAVFGVEEIFRIIEGLKAIHIPGLSDIPVLGRVLFSFDVMVYLSWILVFVTWFYIYKTPRGLALRACGENPNAADTVGIKVKATRMRATLVTGALAAIGGSYLSLVQSSTFIENMTAERGYSAFALIVLGKYHPVWATLGCLLYGFADALQINLQATNSEIPYQFLLMLPYALTLIALMTSKEIVRPESLGRAFRSKGLSDGGSL